MISFRSRSNSMGVVVGAALRALCEVTFFGRLSFIRHHFLITIILTSLVNIMVSTNIRTNAKVSVQKRFVSTFFCT
nr:MAG TPA: hypothetical protein [Caudoviricetes sp.]